MPNQQNKSEAASLSPHPTGSSLLREGGQLFGEFDVIRELGRGGMGKVYLVRSCTTGRHFAVKETLVKDDSQRRAFLAELQTWIDLPDHPNILACRFFRTFGDDVLIFSDYVEGGSLADWIAESRLTSTAQKIDVAIQFARGLHAIHEHGLIHQDVKPGNVLMTKNGIPKVADFGLARSRKRLEGSLLNRDSHSDDPLLVTVAGMTPAYASPEQRLGTALSSKTDMWSWAVSIMDMFLGEPSCPFGGHVARTILEEYIYLACDTKDEQIPVDVAEVLRRCLQTDPARRWTSLEAVEEALISVYTAAAGDHYKRGLPQREAVESRLIESPSHRRYSLTPEEWLDYSAKLTGQSPQIKLHKSVGAKSSLIEAIRIMDDVVQVMQLHMDDSQRDSIQRYFDASYVSADLYRRLSDEHGCLDQLRSTIKILLSRDLSKPTVQFVLGAANHSYAIALRDFGRIDVALEAVGESLRFLESSGNEPGRTLEEVECLQTLATILADQGKYPQALRVFKQVIGLLEYQQAEKGSTMLALALNNAGLCARNCGMHDLAIETYAKCIQIRESLLADQPDDWLSTDQLAGTLGNLSAALCDVGRMKDALEAINKAVSYRSELIQKNSEPELRVTLAKAQLNRASVFFQMEFWEDAIHEYANVIENIDPLLELEGRYDLRSLSKIASSNQDSAFQKLEEKSMQEADAAYAKIVSRERQTASKNSGQWRGVMLSRLLSNWAGLKRAFDQPGAAWLLIDEAIKVLETMERTLQLSETSAALVMSYRNLGSLLLEFQYFSGAEKALSKSRQYCIESGDAEQYCFISMFLAKSQAAQGKISLGEAVLQEATNLALLQNDTVAWKGVMIRRIYDARGKLEDQPSKKIVSFQLLQQARRIAFEAQHHHQGERIEQAICLYEKALELDPSIEAHWINLAVLYAKVKRFESAMRCCDRAAALDVNNGNIWLNRGLIDFERRHFAEAATSFERARLLGIEEAGAKAAYCIDIVEGRV